MIAKCEIATEEPQRNSNRTRDMQSQTGLTHNTLHGGADYRLVPRIVSGELNSPFLAFTSGQSEEIHSCDRWLLSASAACTASLNLEGIVPNNDGAASGSYLNLWHGRRRGDVEGKR